MRTIAAMVAMLIGGAAQAAPAPVPAKVTVMVLGTYHMGNPVRDLHNARIDPVTTPAKQAQLRELAARLATFRPTVIAVEQSAADATLADPGYAAFRPDDLASKSNEIVQIGYRTAALTKARVIAIDEQDRPGEPSYFPFDAVADWVAKHGRQGELDAQQAKVGAMVARQEADQRTLTVRQLLAAMNRPGGYDAMHGDFYYGLLRYGAGAVQPGAELNGRWYTRNAKIFAKLAQVTRPGDRVLVVYGAGHLYWLKHFARETPGFALVEAADVIGRK